jgi:predicted permease
MSDPLRARLAIAAAAFAIVAPLAYMAQRVFEVARGPAMDAALIVRSTHTAFYWRASIATWIGGIAVIAALAIVRRTDVSARWLARSAIPIAIAIAVSAWLAP